MSKQGGTKFISFAVGAIIGSIIALLLAPFSGKKMRKLTGEKGKEAIDQAKKRYVGFEKDSVKPIVSKAKKQGVSFWDKAKKSVSKSSKDLNVKASSVKKNLVSEINES